MNLMTQRIEISYKTVIFVIACFLALYLLYIIRDIIFLVMVSFIFSAGLRPAVERMEKLKIPRTVSIVIIYLFIISLIALIISFIIPPLVSQTIKLAKQLAYLLDSFSPYVDISPQQITDKLTPLTGDIFRATWGVFSNIFNIFTLLVFTFYLLLERRHMRLFLKNFLGEKIKNRIVKVILEMENKLGAWARGQLTLALIIGSFSFVGLKFLQIEPVLPLAILAGILEMVPMIGPIISAIPAVLVASGTSWWLALSVIIFYFLVQQLENHLIVPLVMKRAVGVPPLISLLAFLIGAKIAGVIGIILSIPVFLCLQVLVQEFIFEKEKETENVVKDASY